MAGRPPLPIGQHGEIRYSKPSRTRKITAYCQYRDLDGRTRQVQACGQSKAEAVRELKTNLATRSASTAADITGDTRVKIAAEGWYATIVAAVEAGERSPSTAAQYRSFLDRHVIPAAGDLRLREATPGRLDAILLTIKAKSGAPTAKSCRTVLSGILGWAARQDAVSTNATRFTSAIPTKPQRQPRALSVEEIGRWLARLAADEQAVRHDLIDLSAFMIGSGTRIGEALALQWDDIDLVGTEALAEGARRQICTVSVDWTLIRLKGKGLIRKPVKTAAGLRTLRLPEFIVTMLKRRAFELWVLRTGELPPPAVVSGQLCGGSGEFCGGSGIRKKTGRSDGVQNPSSQVATFPGPRSMTVGQSPAGNSADIADSAEGGPCACVVVEALRALAGTPVFPDSHGGWRDPSNTRRDIRSARGEEFSWVTSHSYRKTAATLLDQAGLTARQIANVLGHSRISLTQDVYMARGLADGQAAAAMDRSLGEVFSMDKPLPPDFNHKQSLA